MPRLLLLTTTTGYQAQQFRDAAERAGFPLVLASNNCHALEDPWRDGALPIHFHQPKASAAKIREFASRHAIDGVIAIGDAPTMTAAVTALELGLRFHPPEAVEACRNKFVARERYKAAGMRVPWYQRFKAHSDEHLAARAVPYPCVLKPLGLSASRGVIRANKEAEFAEAFARIRRLLGDKDVKILREETTGWIQVESFIPGREFALEGLVTGGRLRVLAIFDKPDPLDGPHFEETIYVTPSRASDGEQRQLTVCAEQAVSALGLTDGPVHIELRLNDEGAWMLDIAARPIGGLCAGALRFGSHSHTSRREGGVVATNVAARCVGHPDAVSLEELILRHAAGEDVSGYSRESCASGVMMIPIPHEGFYEGVEGSEEAERVPAIDHIEITAKYRQKLVPLPEGASYLGFIFARAETPAEVEQALRDAHSMLRFQISAAIPVL
ncbi:MAG: ATP-grasp domain-containing protein [Terriglobales bacterium]